MKKTRKWLILSALLALCIAACTCLFVGCVDPNPEDQDTSYAVTVLLEDETPASGVKVQLRKGSSTVGNAVMTGADGKAEFEAADDNYTVRITDLPDHYSIPKGADLTLTATKKTLTVKLEKDFVYTVKLVNPNGTAYTATGITVQICDDNGTCLTAVPLGANGVTTLSGDSEKEYLVKVNNLPEGKMIETSIQHSDAYYSGGSLTEDENEITITVYDVVTVITPANKMDAAAKTAYAAVNDAYDEAAQAYEAYKVTKSLAAGDAVIYKLTTPVTTGKYRTYINDEWLSDYSGKVLNYTANWSGGTVYNGYNYLLDGAANYLIKVENNGTETKDADLVITLPASAYVKQTGHGADLQALKATAGHYVIIEFTPDQAGTYTLTVKKGVVAYATTSEYGIEEVPYETIEGYEPNATAQITVHLSAVNKGSTVYFGVMVQANNNIDVDIVKTTASQDKYDYVAVDGTLADYNPDTEGKELYGVAMDGTATLVYNETDGYYHLGTTDGAVVVVNLTGDLDESRFSVGGQLAYLETTTGLFGPQVTYSYDKSNDPAVEDIVDYIKLLRGFTYAEYDVKPLGPGRDEYLAPDPITTPEYYTKHVNKDGVYPLTQELYDFLHDFYAANNVYGTFDSFVPAEAATAQCGWMFPLYYYDTATVADVIVGEYKFDKGTVEGDHIQVGDNGLTEDDYKLVVRKNNTFTIYECGKMGDTEILSGTWSKKGEVYTFTEPGFADFPAIDYAVTFNPTAGTIKIEQADGGIVWEFHTATQA